MPITLHCPACHRLLTAPDDRAGTRATCPSCKVKVFIPGRPPGPPKLPAADTVTLELPSEQATAVMPSLPPLLPASDKLPGNRPAESRETDVLSNERVAYALFGLILGALKSSWRRVPTCVMSWPLFLLFFLPWIDVSCQGRSMVTQSGLQSAYGGAMVNQAMQRMEEDARVRGMGQPEMRQGNELWSPLMVLYAVAILFSILFGLACIACLVLKFRKVAAAIHVLSLVGSSLAFFLLLVQMVLLFPIENRISENLAKTRAEQQARAQQNAGRPGPFGGGDLFPPGAAEALLQIEIHYTAWFWINLAMLMFAPIVLVAEGGFTGWEFWQEHHRAKAEG